MSILVVGFIVAGIGIASLASGALFEFLEKPKIKFLKSKNNYSFAFAFDWPASKDQSKIDYIKLSLFNPFGNPTRSDVVRSFKAFDQPFAQEVEMGQALANFLGASGFSKAEVGIELGSSKDGVSYQFSYKGSNFQELLKKASTSVEDEQKSLTSDTNSLFYEVPVKSFIADPMPAGESVQLVIPTNPAFQALFAGAGNSGGAGESKTASTENFKVAKVWIEPGCIVCNACEDIYGDVFDVQPDTCVIKPNAPLDNGLRIQEAAEGCPVEVIKYTKIGA